MIHYAENLEQRKLRTGSKTCTTSHCLCDNGNAHANKSYVKREVTCPECKKRLKVQDNRL